ncbi:carbohydrate ABC transporter permease [Pseudonocardia acidicola]|uniref:Carbohydrate ABC transporter permease n=1 Tax=Pseudonocardia acidicola TaxID=2724939 RepID=A0ABX1S6W1_9PSEU|nr:carbohydrate ABC transporter permease [Pseudonocardia acidicola]NMH96547.1 carbohydrate ABC transporter permease [Pseudonocardia acidicola]
MSVRRKVLIHILALIALVWTVVPIVWIVLISLMYHHEFASAQIHLFPHQPTPANYIRLLGGDAPDWNGAPQGPNAYGSLIRQGLLNSAEVAVWVTVLSMIVAVPAAYALSRVQMRFRQAGLLTIVATRSIPPVATTIPFFALYQSLGLSGTKTGLVIAHMTITVPLLVWIGTSFFGGLPPGLERMARVDGCSRWRAFARVVVPASRHSMTAMAVIAFITSWDEFTFALIFNTGTPAQTFPPALSSMFFQVSVPTDVASATVLGLIPPLLVAGIFQRYIRKVNLVGL